MQSVAVAIRLHAVSVLLQVVVPDDQLQPFSDPQLAEVRFVLHAGTVPPVQVLVPEIELHPSWLVQVGVVDVLRLAHTAVGVPTQVPPTPESLGTHVQPACLWQ
jgi:hypothetical protein